MENIEDPKPVPNIDDEGVPKVGVAVEAPKAGVDEGVPKAGVEEGVPNAGVAEEVPNGEDAGVPNIAAERKRREM